MTIKTEPFMSGKYGWEAGESGWKDGVDENFLKFSYMIAGVVDALVSGLPSTPADGYSCYNNTDKTLNAYVDGEWYTYTPPVGYVFTTRAEGSKWQCHATGFTQTMSSEDKTKLNGVAPFATANSPNYVLLDRANHTGTQAMSTISGLSSALAGKLDTSGGALTGALSVAGSLQSTSLYTVQSLPNHTFKDLSTATSNITAYTAYTSSDGTTIGRVGFLAGDGKYEIVNTGRPVKITSSLLDIVGDVSSSGGITASSISTSGTLSASGTISSGTSVSAPAVSGSTATFGTYSGTSATLTGTSQLYKLGVGTSSVGSDVLAVNGTSTFYGHTVVNGNVTATNVNAQALNGTSAKVSAAATPEVKVVDSANALNFGRMFYSISSDAVNIERKGYVVLEGSAAQTRLADQVGTSVLTGNTTTTKLYRGGVQCFEADATNTKLQISASNTFLDATNTQTTMKANGSVVIDANASFSGLYRAAVPVVYATNALVNLYDHTGSVAFQIDSTATKIKRNSVDILSVSSSGVQLQDVSSRNLLNFTGTSVNIGRGTATNNNLLYADSSSTLLYGYGGGNVSLGSSTGANYINSPNGTLAVSVTNSQVGLVNSNNDLVVSASSTKSKKEVLAGESSVSTTVNLASVGAVAHDYSTLPSNRGAFLYHHGTAYTGTTTQGLTKANLAMVMAQNTSGLLLSTNDASTTYVSCGSAAYHGLEATSTVTKLQAPATGVINRVELDASGTRLIRNGNPTINLTGTDTSIYDQNYAPLMKGNNTNTFLYRNGFEVFKAASGDIRLTDGASNVLFKSATGGVVELKGNDSSAPMLQASTDTTNLYRVGASTTPLILGSSSQVQLFSPVAPVIAATSTTVQINSGNGAPAISIDSTGLVSQSSVHKGTFTPTVAGSTAAGSATYSVQSGFYTRIDNLVFFRLRMIWTGHTGGTGELIIKGLPFTANGNPHSGTVGIFNYNIGAAKVFTWYMTSNFIALYACDPTTNYAAIAAPVSSGGEIIINGYYEV